MAKLFNFESPLIRFLSRLGDLMILNLLFLLTSVPLVTIGASWTALYCVTLKMVREEEGSIPGSFFRSFRQNFRQATLLWLGVLVLAALLVLDLWVLRGAAGTPAEIMRTCILLLGLLLLMVLQYLFPGLARFDASIKDTVRNACLLALGNLPKTALMTAASLGAVYLSCLSNLTISVSMALFLLLGFSLLALGNSAILVKLLDPCLPKQPPDPS